MALFKQRDREARRRFNAHHTASVKAAQTVYDKYADQDTVTHTLDTEEWYLVTAASPKREAWDTYFYSMQKLGEDPWKGYKRFGRDLKTK